MEEAKHIAEWFALAIELIAAMILLWGIIKALGLFGYTEIFCSLRRQKSEKSRHLFVEIRMVLGNYLLLGLELMIAADIIHTIVSRTRDDLIFLGVLVVIRTLISYFLSKEMEALERKRIQESHSQHR